MDGSRGVVLIAEDEELVRNMIAVILRSDGYHVLLARDGAEALELSRNHQEHIDLLVSDVEMPEINGIELAKIMVAERPDTKVLLASGSLGLDIPAVFKFLQKPFRVIEMRQAIAELLGSPALKAGSL